MNEQTNENSTPVIAAEKNSEPESDLFFFFLTSGSSEDLPQCKVAFK